MTGSSVGTQGRPKNAPKTHPRRNLNLSSIFDPFLQPFWWYFDGFGMFSLIIFCASAADVCRFLAFKRFASTCRCPWGAAVSLCVYNPPRPSALGVWNYILRGFTPPNPPRPRPAHHRRPYGIIFDPLGLNGPISWPVYCKSPIYPISNQETNYFDPFGLNGPKLRKESKVTPFWLEIGTNIRKT